MIKQNYYQLLGIAPNASTKEVKVAFRKLAKIYHPDVNENLENKSDEQFKDIQLAYSTLLDAKKRLKYNQEIGVIQNYTIPYSSFNGSTYSFAQEFYKKENKTTQTATPKQNTSSHTPERYHLLISILFAVALVVAIILYGSRI
jgi:curved DNA-binding protein CbpA